MTLAARRSRPDDYWLNKSFARKYVLNNLNGIQQNPGAREFSGACFMAQMQGINYLCPSPKSILDVGCGHATRAANIKASLGCKVVGVDYSEAMLDEARNIAAMLPEAHRPELKRGDAYDLPFEDNEFDVVICYGLLMSLERPGQSDLLRVAKYGLVAIEESDTCMTPEQREAWLQVKDEKFPGRIFWHDYLRAFGHFRQIVTNPLPTPESWNLGPAPGYIRIIVVKRPHDGDQNVH